MASSKDYLNFILEQLSGLEGITYRAMMGEFILYYQERIFGGIYDDRQRAKPMLLVEEVDDSAFLCELCEAMLPELPAPKKKKPKA